MQRGLLLLRQHRRGTGQFSTDSNMLTGRFSGCGRPCLSFQKPFYHLSHANPPILTWHEPHTQASLQFPRYSRNQSLTEYGEDMRRHK